MKDIKKIQEKLVQWIGRVNEKNPYYLIGGFLVLILVLDYLLIMQFQVRTLHALGAKITDERAKVTKSQEDIQRFAAYQNQLKRLREKYETVNSKIRTKEDIPLILESISRIANKYGIRMAQVLPNTSLMEPILKDNDGQYFAIPIQVQAKGAYHDFGRFLNQLENEEIFMRISEFVIRAGRDDHTRHDIDLTLQAIVFENKGKK